MYCRGFLIKKIYEYEISRHKKNNSVMDNDYFCF